jgi:enamine deaminase RidA (YjgF/YER057c/UK114 family)
MTKQWKLPIDRPHNLIASAGPITFIGGAGDFDHSGSIRNTDTISQVQGSLENIAQLLPAENCSMDDVVKIKAYYTPDDTITEWEILAQIANTFKTNPLPVISTVPVPMQPFANQRIQIQVMAQRNWRNLSDVRVHEDPIPESQQHLFNNKSSSSALRAGEFITVANRTAAYLDDHIESGLNSVDESHVIMDSMNNALQTVGASLQDSIKMEGYYFGTVREQWKPLALARASHFAEPGPVATVVPCHTLSPADATTKIEVIAMRELRATFDKYITRDDHWPPRVWDWMLNLPYRQAIRLRDMIWLGGQVPAEPFSNTAKRVHPHNLELQTTYTMSYIEDLLRGWNRSASDLKLSVCYFTSTGDPNQSEFMANLLTDTMSGVLQPLTLVPQPHMQTAESMVEIWGVAQG